MSTSFWDTLYIPDDEISGVNDEALYPTLVPNVDQASIHFVKALSQLRLKQFDVKLIPLYSANKVKQ